MGPKPLGPKSLPGLRNEGPEKFEQGSKLCYAEAI